MVTVVDSTPPIITFASDKTVDCGSNWTFDWPSAYDLCCGTNVTIISLGMTTNGNSSTQLVSQVWQATDCCSNSATCTQTVTVICPNPSAPVAIDMYVDSAGVHIIFPTALHYRYTVLYADTLSAGSTWTVLGQPVEGDGTVHTVVDPGPLQATRFYRVRVVSD